MRKFSTVSLGTLRIQPPVCELWKINNGRWIVEGRRVVKRWIVERWVGEGRIIKGRRVVKRGWIVECRGVEVGVRVVKRSWIVEARVNGR